MEMRTLSGMITHCSMRIHQLHYLDLQRLTVVSPAMNPNYVGFDYTFRFSRWDGWKTGISA